MLRSLETIARDIRADWKKPYFGAVPYLEAMRSLGCVDDTFGYDDGRSIILYFLSNAGTWRGPTAKAIKAELKAMLAR
jgi:hypothetical protein